MHLKTLLASFLLAAPLAVGSAADFTVLLTGNIHSDANHRTTVREGARAILKLNNNESRVDAPEIAFEKKANRLVCKGDARVTTSMGTIAGHDLTIRFGNQRPTVFVVNLKGIVIAPKPDDELTFEHTMPLPDFRFSPELVR